MIDIHEETLVPVSQVPSCLPGRPHVSTIWRWVNKGVRGVRLETILIGGVRHTSREALQRFCDETTAAADGKPQQTRTPRRKQKAIDQAKAELAAAGF